MAFSLANKYYGVVYRLMFTLYAGPPLFVCLLDKWPDGTSSGTTIAL